MVKIVDRSNPQNLPEVVIKTINVLKKTFLEIAQDPEQKSREEYLGKAFSFLSEYLKSHPDDKRASQEMGKLIIGHFQRKTEGNERRLNETLDLDLPPLIVPLAKLESTE